MNPGVQLTLAAVFAFAGWQHARNLERKFGRRAFNWPDWVWAVVTGLSLLLGAILLVIAERQLKKAPAIPITYGFSPAPGGAYGYAPQAAGALPAAAMPVAPVPPVPAQVPAVPAQVPAGWQPDPSGRHQHRWWDGERWTTSVASNGVVSTDA